MCLCEQCLPVSVHDFLFFFAYEEHLCWNLKIHLIVLINMAEARHWETLSVVCLIMSLCLAGTFNLCYRPKPWVCYINDSQKKPSAWQPGHSPFRTWRDHGSRDNNTTISGSRSNTIKQNIPTKCSVLQRFRPFLRSMFISCFYFVWFTGFICVTLDQSENARAKGRLAFKLGHNSQDGLKHSCNYYQSSA